MKIKMRQPLAERVGQIRTRKIFLWWPMRVKNEWWWWVNVKITEEIVCSPGDLLYCDIYRWDITKVESEI